MGNKSDGHTIKSKLIKVGNHYEPEFLTLNERQVIENIGMLVEKGEFSKVEQQNYSQMMKAVDKQGGIKCLNDGALKELEHIVKTLGSSGDKSVMIEDELKNFLDELPGNKRKR